MKTKRTVVLALTCIIVLSLGLAVTACKKDSPPPEPEPTPPGPSITISQSTAELDVYDTLTLTAQTANTDATVVWTSSAPAVASVESGGGLVTALTVGNAVITATAGDISASCAVTVTDSGTAPVMRLDFERVSVAEGGEITVTVSTDWKNEPIPEAISYSWTLADGESDAFASITPQDGGSRAVIKGLGYGETAFCVSASVRGSTLVRKVSVKVCNTDVVFDVRNLTLTEGAYSAELSLVATDSGVTQITPDIVVYDKDTLVENTEITWTNSDSAVASIQDGVITGLREGVTTLTGTYNNNDIKIQVNVYRPVIELTQTAEIETADGTFDLNTLSGVTLAGEVTGAKIDGKSVFSSYDADTKTVSFDAELLPKAVSELGEGRQFTIDTTLAQYSLEAAIYSMVISDETELNAFLDFAKESKIGSSWSGLFVLGNDIVCEGTYASRYESGNTTGDMGKAAGFNGTFDGRGHTVYNLHTVGTSGGFVSPLGQHGVLKNVSFVNAKNTGNGAFISSYSSGTIENVYIQIDVTPNGGEEVQASSVIFCDAPGECRVNNVIVEYINRLPDDATTGYPLWRFNFSCNIINGVYAIGVPKFNQTSNFTDRYDVYGVYDDWAAVKADGKIDFSSWENDFWGLVDGIPVPKTFIEADAAPAIGNTSLAVAAGSSVDILSDSPYVAFSLDADALAKGLTISGRTVTVPADTDCTGFTVTATSAINGKTATATFSLPTTVQVEQKEVEINKAYAEQTEVSIDLAGVSFDGEISSARIGSLDFTTVIHEGSTLKLDKATVADMYGENTIVAIAEATDGKQTILNIPVLLVTKYISDAASLQNLGNYMVTVAGGKSGYFVQTADIDAAGKTTFNASLVSDTFCGVYDGRGHVISSLTVSGYEVAMFKVMAAGSAVKNLTFMDAVIDANGGIVASEMSGTVENVVVYGSYTSTIPDVGASYAPSSLLVSKVKEGGLVKNCLVVAKDHPFTAENTYAGMLCGDFQGGTIENCLAINLKNGATRAEWAMPAIGKNSEGDRLTVNTDTDTVHTFHGWDAYTAWAADQDLSAYNGSAWKFLSNNVPVTTAESVQAELTAVEADDVTLAVGAQTVVLGGEGWYASYAVGTLPAGITYDAGVFDVAETAYGSFTVTVSSLIGDASVVRTYRIVETINVTDRREVGVDTGWERETVDVDLTGISFEGDIKSATIGDVTFENSDISYDSTTNTLKLNWTLMKPLYGEKTMVAAAETADGKQTVLNIPVLLVTKYISDTASLQNLKNYGYMVTVEGGKSGYFVQTADIDASGITASGNGSLGIDKTFYGVYDGRDYTISNLTVSGYEAGMFEKMAAGSVVKNLTFRDAVIDANGGIVASECFGTVENVVVYGSYANTNNDKGANYAPSSLLVSKLKEGGLVKNCLVVANDHPFTAEEDTYAGMLCGDFQGGTIENCIGINLKDGTTRAEWAMPAVGKNSEGGRLAENTDTDTVHTFHGYDAFKTWAETADLSAYNAEAARLYAELTATTA